jgi:hypothetical protein
MVGCEITLIENSTAGNYPKIFVNQTVDITREPDTVEIGTDGYAAHGSHPSEIFWLGGTSQDLAHITHVRIVGKDGTVLIDGELNTFNSVPNDVANGVQFCVL